MKRQALGKGLGSLLPPRPPAGPVAEEFQHIDLDRIVANPSQPREHFDETELEDLASSIRAAGILQPILVRETGAGFQLIAGERRLRAARMAGLRKVPAMIQRAEGERSLELALIENIQRQQLNAIEEARAFRSLISEYGLTQEQVADRVGRKRPSVANTLRLLKLPQRVQDLVREGKLTHSHARALLALPSDEQILRAAESMIESYVTVRGVEEIARKARPDSQAAPRATLVDPNVRAAEERLQRVLGTKVRIKYTAKGKGRIEIDFYTDEELERLFESLEGLGPQN